MRKNRFILFAIIISLFYSISYAQNNEASWFITATEKENYTGAPIANGTIGLLPWKEPFSVRHVILNHVFDISKKKGVNQVLKGINPFQMKVYIDGELIEEKNITDWEQSIDMKRAIHTTRFTVPGKAKIEYQIFALRNLPHSGLVSVKVEALKDIDFKAASEMDVPGGYRNVQNTFKSLKAGGRKTDILQARAESENGKQNVCASSLFIYPDTKFSFQNIDNKSSELTSAIKKGEVADFSLAASVCSTRDFVDPFSESERQVIYMMHEGIDLLLASHYRLWNELWQSDIVIDGDDEAQQVVRFALFNLYSSCREGTNLNIPPMGLSSQGYNGHVFWDSEIWMFPPMLFLNKGISESMINYRTDRIAAAQKRAFNHGYRGVMFPWESDDNGEESTPVFAITGQFEHHITADIAIACWNYYCMNKDLQWLKTKGYPLMKKAAEFWVSRVTENADGTYSIVNVVGADEYAEGITDNAFTNGAAIKALEYATKAAQLCGEKPSSKWMEVSRKIVIHKLDNGVTSEYLGYNGEKIKQVDANLLGFPLGIITDPAQQKKDLEYYVSKIDNVHGPAMTYSVFCIQYARLGDKKKATEMFDRCFRPNIRPPFNVLAETPTSQNPYFMTCAGGILQAVINGFGGLDITEEGIVQTKTMLPAKWKKLTLKGIGPDMKTYTITQ